MTYVAYILMNSFLMELIRQETKHSSKKKSFTIYEFGTLLYELAFRASFDNCAHDLEMSNSGLKKIKFRLLHLTQLRDLQIHCVYDLCLEHHFLKIF